MTELLAKHWLFIVMFNYAASFAVYHVFKGRPKK